MQRLFFALWPDAAARAALVAAADAALDATAARRPAPADLHVTLAFLGTLPPPQLTAASAVAAALPVAPVAVCLDALEWWMDGRLLCATSSSSAAVDALAATLHAGLRGAGLKLDERVFRAHVTLARLPARAAASCVSAPPALHPVLAEPAYWMAHELLLAGRGARDDGARYAVLARWPLA